MEVLIIFVKTFLLLQQTKIIFLFIINFQRVQSPSTRLSSLRRPTRSSTPTTAPSSSASPTSSRPSWVWCLRNTWVVEYFCSWVNSAWPFHKLPWEFTSTFSMMSGSVKVSCEFCRKKSIFQSYLYFHFTAYHHSFLRIVLKKNFFRWLSFWSWII